MTGTMSATSVRWNFHKSNDAVIYFGADQDSAYYRDYLGSFPIDPFHHFYVREEKINPGPIQVRIV